MEKKTQAQLHKKRMVNIEILRLLAMMMVVSLHYLAKGELLPRLTGPLDAQGHLAWLLESFSIAAVDVYILISGYFLVETGFRCKRVISLVLQVMFYTCLIPVILVVTGYLPAEEITFYHILQYLFPTNMLHYWFVSAYVLMFLFTPVLNAAVHVMKKGQLQAAIVILLLMESVSKTVIPVRLELDNLGYDAYWFMVVYLIAAYIRLYGISFFEAEENGGGGSKKRARCRRAALCYILLCLAIYGLTMLIRGAFLLTGQFENFIESAYGYNHLLTIGAAVALFYTFKNLKIGGAVSAGKTEGTKGAGKITDAVLRLAPCSFGVYLLHEHINIRYEWPFWLGAGQCGSALSLFGHWIAAVFIVMAVGLIIDYIRSLLFSGAERALSGSRLNRALKKADDRVNGKEHDR